MRRVQSTPFFLLDFLKKADKRKDYTSYTPSEGEYGLMSDYFLRLPPLSRKILKERLIGIYFVNNVIKVLNDVTDFATPLVKSTGDLIENLYESIGIAREILAKKDSTAVKDLIGQFDNLNQEFEKSWDEAGNLITEEELQKKLSLLPSLLGKASDCIYRPLEEG